MMSLCLGKTSGAISRVRGFDMKADLHSTNKARQLCIPALYPKQSSQSMRMTAAESAISLEQATPAQETSVELEVPAPEREVMDLFDRFRTPLLRYVTGFGLPVQDAEEIVQEVFLSLFQHLRRGKSRENLAGWVFRVAYNLALKLRASPIYKEKGSDEAHSIADPAPGPEDECAANQAQHRLQGVFRALPEPDRQCLALRAEGLRYREIAEVLGMSLGSVANSVTRSLARLTRAADR